jgi:hypothetical protein
MAQDSGVDPFEQFRKQRKGAHKPSKEDEKSLEKLGWVEGFGPTGNVPEGMPEGYIKGRFDKTKVAPAELKALRPQGYESTSLTPSGADPYVAQIEAALKKAEADLQEALDARNPQLITRISLAIDRINRDLAEAKKKRGAVEKKDVGPKPSGFSKW